MIERPRAPSKLLFGEVQGLGPPGCFRSSLSDVVVHDCQDCSISTACRAAQDKLLWGDETCTHQAHQEPESSLKRQ